MQLLCDILIFTLLAGVFAMLWARLFMVIIHDFLNI